MDSKRIPHTRIWSTLAGIGCLLQAGSLSAAGFAVRNQSASGLGTGLASDTVNSYDASGLFTNPALMSGLAGQNVSLGLNYVNADIKVDNATLTNTSPAGAGPNPNQGKNSIDEVSEPAVIPSIFGVHQINETVHVGWAVTVPWATNTKYSEDWTGRYWATKTDLQVTEIALAGSYKLNELFDVGLALNYQTAKGKLNSAVDVGLATYASAPSTATATLIGNRDAISKFEADSTALGFQIGVLAKPMPDLRIGFSYRAPVKHEAEGSIKFTGTSPAADAILAAASANPALADSNDASLDLELPAVYSLGAAYTHAAFTYYGNLTHTGWDTFDSFDVKYNNTVAKTKLDWENSLYAAIGADYRLDQALTLRFGLSHDQGVTSDKTRTPRTPDNDRKGISLGAGYQASPNVKVNAAYQKLFLADTTIDLSDQQEGAALRGNLKADYKINPNIFMASVDVIF